MIPTPSANTHPARTARTTPRPNEAPPQTDEAWSGYCLYKRLRSIVRGLLAQPQLLGRSRRQ
jgi:hypothetical protein